MGVSLETRMLIVHCTEAVCCTEGIFQWLVPLFSLVVLEDIIFLDHVHHDFLDMVSVNSAVMLSDV